MRLREWACITLLLIFANASQAVVTATQEEYHGWPGAYRLSNGTVDLVFVPQIGRIMRYGYVGERNVLWENTMLAGKATDLSRLGTDWQNYGGDKLWPSPQSKWGWPPDPTSDSGPQKVSLMPDKHLLVIGPVSLKYGVQFQREIALNPTGTAVTIRNSMANTGAIPVEWGVWEVAQTDDPEETGFAAAAKTSFPQGYKLFGDQTPPDGQVTLNHGVVTIRRRADHSAKIGTRSPDGRIESHWGALRFRISGDFPKGGSYPDDGCAQEIYTSDDPNRYVEMELLGPVRKLRTGDASTLVTHWSLDRTP
jgi:hypothetical protein